MGTGKESSKMDKSIKLLQTISHLKPIQTKAKKRIPTLGVRPGLPIGCKVTVRRNTEQLLKNLFQSVGNKISIRKFDSGGNFSFGIPEYLDIPGIEYNPEIGIIGLEVAITLKRAGFRIKERKIKVRKIPQRHRISKEEAVEFVKNKFNVEVEEKWQQVIGKRFSSSLRTNLLN